MESDLFHNLVLSLLSCSIWLFLCENPQGRSQSITMRIKANTWIAFSLPQNVPLQVHTLRLLNLASIFVKLYIKYVSTVNLWLSR